jgi:hypothetical protein
MTREHDFDRTARAWLDYGPNEAPERAVDAVLHAIESTPQVRRRVRWPTWRPFTMNRLPLLAALAALVIVVIGVLSLTSGRRPQVAPSASPAPAVVAPAAPNTAADYATPRPLPAALEGGWVRPAGDDAALVSSQVATIAFGELDGNPSASDYRIDRPNEPPVQGANVHEIAPGVIEINANEPTGSCVNGETGRYAWSVTDDGQWMTLTPDGTDKCVTRARLLPGTWQRSMAHDSIGGPGIAVNLQPYVLYTLPRMSWKGWGGSGRDAVAVDSADGTRSLRIWKNVDGFADACDISKGRANLEPGMDAFVRYLSTDPRFKVTHTEDLTVDGHRAVAVTFRIGDGIKAPCRELDGNDTAKGGVLLWVQRSANSDASWATVIASADTLVVTEVDGASIVFEAAVTEAPTGDGDFVADRTFLDSVKFVNELPSPPAS